MQAAWVPPRLSQSQGSGRAGAWWQYWLWTPGGSRRPALGCWSGKGGRTGLAGGQGLLPTPGLLGSGRGWAPLLLRPYSVHPWPLGGPARAQPAFNAQPGPHQLLLTLEAHLG